MTTTDTTTLTNEQALGVLGILGVTVGLVLLLLLVFYIIRYVFQALGFYTMAKNRGIQHPWLAWIPIAQDYLFGEIVDDEVFGIKGAKWILPLSVIYAYFVNGYLTTTTDAGFLYIVLFVILVCFAIYTLGAMYKLFKGYSTHPVLFTILSIIIPFLGPIFIFAIRNNAYDLNKQK